MRFTTPYAARCVNLFSKYTLLLFSPTSPTAHPLPQFAYLLTPHKIGNLLQAHQSASSTDQSASSTPICFKHRPICFKHTNLLQAHTNLLQAHPLLQFAYLLTPHKIGNLHICFKHTLCFNLHICQKPHATNPTPCKKYTPYPNLRQPADAGIHHTFGFCGIIKAYKCI